MGYGFTPGERLGAYVTFMVTGEVVGLPITGGDEAQPDGTFLGKLQLSPNVPRGLYALTMEGLQSGNKAIVYFRKV